MNSFERRVLDTIDRYNLIKKGQTVIAAVSGGYDSLCMMHVLFNLRSLRKFEVCVAHVNHMLRSEADEDEQYVIKEAEKLGITVYTAKFDVSKYAKENKMSFETAGRILRYGFFEEISKNYTDTAVATAHNANDSAESMLMHLMRGSGLSGLVGIRPQNGNIIRPLIEAQRIDIEKYCDENGIVPRHDVTNDSDDYYRNYVRHNILGPMLEKSSIASLCRTMDVLTAEDEFLDLYTENIRREYVVTDGEDKRISVKLFNGLPLAVKRRLLRAELESDTEKQLCLVHIDDIISMIEKNYGNKQICLPLGRVVKIEKGEVIL